MIFLDDVAVLAAAEVIQEQEVLTPDSVKQGAHRMIEFAKTDRGARLSGAIRCVRHLCASKYRSVDRASTGV